MSGTSSTSEFPYLHGFSATEQARLKKQARLAESTIFHDIDYTGVRRLLEVGSGVGAQTEILLRRFPDLHVTCVDLNDGAARAPRAPTSARMPWLEGRYALHQADATDLPFEPRSFDAAFLCWVLEHVPSPARVLNEVRRVLAPGAPVYITEVMNASFLLDPYSPNVWRYWMAFNDFQYRQRRRSVRRRQARQPAARRRLPRRHHRDQDVPLRQSRAGAAQDDDRVLGGAAAVGRRPVAGRGTGSRRMSSRACAARCTRCRTIRTRCSSMPSCRRARRCIEAPAGRIDQRAHRGNRASISGETIMPRIRLLRDECAFVVIATNGAGRKSQAPMADAIDVCL